MATVRRKYAPGAFSLLVKRSTAGLGLFAGDPIPKNACIIEYVGRQVTPEEERTSRSRYLFSISKHKTIDGKPRDNKAGYINHSCVPNAEPYIHKGRVFIFATKAIKPGEEITYDYGKEYFDEYIKGVCRCPKCSAKNKPNRKQSTALASS
ncbi:MAG TPA: SET domain-containing protein [Candidatus Paceibacterota bacterium]|jgi:hypothetical protein